MNPTLKLLWLAPLVIFTVALWALSGEVHKAEVQSQRLDAALTEIVEAVDPPAAGAQLTEESAEEAAEEARPSHPLTDLLRALQKIDDEAKGLTKAQYEAQHWGEIDQLRAWDVRATLPLDDVTVDGVLIFPDQQGFTYGLKYVFAKTDLTQEELLALQKGQETTIRCKLDHLHKGNSVWLHCSEVSQRSR